MKPFDVYHPWKKVFVDAHGATITDDQGNTYLDFYGGHGVISIGHNHPRWKQALTKQLESISYYSNAITIPQQEQVAQALGKLSGLTDYRLFLCNSGAEANENALKIASFYTKRSKILAFKGAFHGRTAGAIAITDNPSIQAPYGSNLLQDFIELDDDQGLQNALETHEYAAVILEGIQGVAGVFEASDEVWNVLSEQCKKTGTLLILDEIQSGCGRTGTYFSFQNRTIRPDLITMAKGIGNGFPVAGVLITNEIEPVKGQLGTTFGGSYLACAAMQAVLGEIEDSALMHNATELGIYLKQQLQHHPAVLEVKGRGLMIGIRLSVKASEVQTALLEKGIVTGTSACAFTLRLLPPLNITKAEIDQFLAVFEETMSVYSTKTTAI
jgi:acetylornithine/N-succinyldiaminopimelate aminotransferase